MERLLLRALTLSYNSAQCRSNHCCASEPLIVLETGLHTSPASIASTDGAGIKPQKPQEILSGLFFLWGSIGQNCCSRSSAPRFHCCFHQISLVCLQTESFCREDFTAAFDLLMGGRRNGNESSERQRRGGSWAFICADTRVSALSFICSLSGPLSEIHVITQLMISEGGFFLCLLDTGNMDMGKQAGRAPVHCLYEQIQIGWLEITSLQFQSPRAAWLMLSESFGTLHHLKHAYKVTQPHCSTLSLLCQLHIHSTSTASCLTITFHKFTTAFLFPLILFIFLSHLCLQQLPQTADYTLNTLRNALKSCGFKRMQ